MESLAQWTSLHSSGSGDTVGNGGGGEEDGKVIPPAKQPFIPFFPWMLLPEPSRAVWSLTVMTEMVPGRRQECHLG